MNNQSLSSAVARSAVLVGVDGIPVSVEAHVGPGLPGFTVVGLPDTTCREVRDRVRAAFLSSGLPWPLRKVTVTIKPDRGRTRTAGLDLPIALALLAAADELPSDRLRDVASFGELGLDGSIRPLHGIVPLVEATNAAAVVVPDTCRVDAELAGGRTIRSAPDLRSAVEALRGDAQWPAQPLPPQPRAADAAPDLARIVYDDQVRRAIEVAAAGGHHLLLVTAPGSGATTLARCLASLLPPLTADEALETARIHSAAGLPVSADGLREPPFRAPHPGTSLIALAGGGGMALAPGELSLAHNGVLFLEDIDSYDRSDLYIVARALDNRTIRVSRARATVELPARVVAVATSRLCPCMATARHDCRCTKQALDLRARRFGSSFFDRFPIRATVSADGHAAAPAGGTAAVAARVAHARSAARRRGVRANAHLTERDDLALTTAAASALNDHQRLGAFSPRGLDDVRRVARTIADLRSVDAAVIEETDVLEAIALRVVRHES